MSSACQLTAKDYRLWVHLGCSAEEKVHSQPISIDIQLEFASPLAAMKTDALSDTFCYFNALENIKKMVEKHQPFNLVEHLAACVYSCVYHDLLTQNFQDVNLTITVNKLTPPVPNLFGGMQFICRGSLKLGVQDDLYKHWF